MRWPDRASPPAPVHAGFLVTAVAATVTYALADATGRRVVYALVTAAPIITFLVALRRKHLPDPRPWRIAIIGLVLLAASNLLFPAWITGHILGRAMAAPPDLLVATAHLALLVGAGAALRRHGANDAGGIMDAAMVGLCSGGPLWEWVVRPQLTDEATPLGQIMLLLDLLFLGAVIGVLVRIGMSAEKARGPLAYLVSCAALTVFAIGLAVLTVNGSSVWTAELMMLAYLALAAAPVHPASPYVTLPPPGRRPAPGHPRLGWLGFALCVNPLIAAVQALGGDGNQSLLLPVGTLMVIPLVLLRIRLLSQQRAKAERTLAHHASHDELTGLYNRRHIVQEIDRALEELRRGELDGIAVLLCDLDGFKPVNDRFGHQAGDLVLQELASRMDGCVRGGDVIGRLGGDEFLILCRGEPERRLPGLRQRISTALTAPVQLPGAQVRVGVTMGTALAGPDTTLGRDALIGLADATMYAGKAQRARPAAPSVDPIVAEAS